MISSVPFKISTNLLVSVFIVYRICCFQSFCVLDSIFCSQTLSLECPWVGMCSLLSKISLIVIHTNPQLSLLLSDHTAIISFFLYLHILASLQKSKQRHNQESCKHVRRRALQQQLTAKSC